MNTVTLNGVSLVFIKRPRCRLIVFPPLTVYQVVFVEIGDNLVIPQLQLNSPQISDNSGS